MTISSVRAGVGGEEEVKGEIFYVTRFHVWWDWNDVKRLQKEKAQLLDVNKKVAGVEKKQKKKKKGKKGKKHAFCQTKMLSWHREKIRADSSTYLY